MDDVQWKRVLSIIITRARRPTTHKHAFKIMKISARAKNIIYTWFCSSVVVVTAFFFFVIFAFFLVTAAAVAVVVVDSCRPCLDLCHVSCNLLSSESVLNLFRIQLPDFFFWFVFFASPSILFIRIGYAVLVFAPNHWPIYFFFRENKNRMKRKTDGFSLRNTYVSKPFTGLFIADKNGPANHNGCMYIHFYFFFLIPIQ